MAEEADKARSPTRVVRVASMKFPTNDDDSPSITVNSQEAVPIHTSLQDGCLSFESVKNAQNPPVKKFDVTNLSTEELHIKLGKFPAVVFQLKNDNFIETDDAPRNRYYNETFNSAHIVKEITLRGNEVKTLYATFKPNEIAPLLLDSNEKEQKFQHSMEWIVSDKQNKMWNYSFKVVGRLYRSFVRVDKKEIRMSVAGGEVGNEVFTVINVSNIPVQCRIAFSDNVKPNTASTIDLHDMESDESIVGTILTIDGFGQHHVRVRLKTKAVTEIIERKISVENINDDNNTISLQLVASVSALPGPIQLRALGDTSLVSGGGGWVNFGSGTTGVVMKKTIEVINTSGRIHWITMKQQWKDVGQIYKGLISFSFSSNTAKPTDSDGRDTSSDEEDKQTGAKPRRAVLKAPEKRLEEVGLQGSTTTPLEQEGLDTFLLKANSTARIDCWYTPRLEETGTNDPSVRTFSTVRFVIQAFVREELEGLFDADSSDGHRRLSYNPKESLKLTASLYCTASVCVSCVELSCRQVDFQDTPVGHAKQSTITVFNRSDVGTTISVIIDSKIIHSSSTEVSLPPNSSYDIHFTLCPRKANSSYRKAAKLVNNSNPEQVELVTFISNNTERDSVIVSDFYITVPKAKAKNTKGVPAEDDNEEIYDTIHEQAHSDTLLSIMMDTISSLPCMSHFVVHNCLQTPATMDVHSVPYPGSEDFGSVISFYSLKPDITDEEQTTIEKLESTSSAIVSDLVNLKTMKAEAIGKIAEDVLAFQRAFNDAICNGLVPVTEGAMLEAFGTLCIYVVVVQTEKKVELQSTIEVCVTALKDEHSRDSQRKTIGLTCNVFDEKLHISRRNMNVGTVHPNEYKRVVLSVFNPSSLPFIFRMRKSQSFMSAYITLSLHESEAEATEAKEGKEQASNWYCIPSHSRRFIRLGLRPTLVGAFHETIIFDTAVKGSQTNSMSIQVKGKVSTWNNPRFEINPMEMHYGLFTIGTKVQSRTQKLCVMNTTNQPMKVVVSDVKSEKWFGIQWRFQAGEEPQLGKGSRKQLEDIADKLEKKYKIMERKKKIDKAAKIKRELSEVQTELVDPNANGILSESESENESECEAEMIQKAVQKEEGTFVVPPLRKLDILCTMEIRRKEVNIPDALCQEPHTSAILVYEAHNADECQIVHVSFIVKSFDTIGIDEEPHVDVIDERDRNRDSPLTPIHHEVTRAMSAVLSREIRLNSPLVVSHAVASQFPSISLSTLGHTQHGKSRPPSPPINFPERKPLLDDKHISSSPGKLQVKPLRIDLGYISAGKEVTSEVKIKCTEGVSCGYVILNSNDTNSKATLRIPDGWSGVVRKDEERHVTLLFACQPFFIEGCTAKHNFIVRNTTTKEDVTVTVVMRPVAERMLEFTNLKPKDPLHSNHRRDDDLLLDFGNCHMGSSASHVRELLVKNTSQLELKLAVETTIPQQLSVFSDLECTKPLTTYFIKISESVIWFVKLTPRLELQYLTNGQCRTLEGCVLVKCVSFSQSGKAVSNTLKIDIRAILGFGILVADTSSVDFGRLSLTHQSKQTFSLSNASTAFPIEYSFVMGVEDPLAGEGGLQAATDESIAYRNTHFVVVEPGRGVLNPGEVITVTCTVDGTVLQQFGLVQEIIQIRNAINANQQISIRFRAFIDTSQIVFEGVSSMGESMPTIEFVNVVGLANPGMAAHPELPSGVAKNDVSIVSSAHSSLWDEGCMFTVSNRSAESLELQPFSEGFVCCVPESEDDCRGRSQTFMDLHETMIDTASKRVLAKSEASEPRPHSLLTNSMVPCGASFTIGPGSSRRVDLRLSCVPVTAAQRNSLLAGAVLDYELMFVFATKGNSNTVSSQAAAKIQIKCCIARIELEEATIDFGKVGWVEGWIERPFTFVIRNPTPSRLCARVSLDMNLLNLQATDTPEIVSGTSSAVVKIATPSGSFISLDNPFDVPIPPKESMVLSGVLYPTALASAQAPSGLDTKLRLWVENCDNQRERVPIDLKFTLTKRIWKITGTSASREKIDLPNVQLPFSSTVPSASFSISCSGTIQVQFLLQPDGVLRKESEDEAPLFVLSLLLSQNKISQLTLNKNQETKVRIQFDGLDSLALYSRLDSCGALPPCPKFANDRVEFCDVKALESAAVARSISGPVRIGVLVLTVPELPTESFPIFTTFSTAETFTLCGIEGNTLKLVRAIAWDRKDDRVYEQYTFVGDYTVRNSSDTDPLFFQVTTFKDYENEDIIQSSLIPSVEEGAVQPGGSTVISFQLTVTSATEYRESWSESFLFVVQDKLYSRSYTIGKFGLETPQPTLEPLSGASDKEQFEQSRRIPTYVSIDDLENELLMSTPTVQRSAGAQQIILKGLVTETINKYELNMGLLYDEVQTNEDDVRQRSKEWTFWVENTSKTNANYSIEVWPEKMSKFARLSKYEGTVLGYSKEAIVITAEPHTKGQQIFHLIIMNKQRPAEICVVRVVAETSLTSSNYQSLFSLSLNTREKKKKKIDYGNVCEGQTVNYKYIDFHNSADFELTFSLSHEHFTSNDIHADLFFTSSENQLRPLYSLSVPPKRVTRVFVVFHPKEILAPRISDNSADVKYNLYITGRTLSSYSEIVTLRATVHKQTIWVDEKEVLFIEPGDTSIPIDECEATLQTQFIVNSSLITQTKLRSNLCDAFTVAEIEGGRTRIEHPNVETGRSSISVVGYFMIPLKITLDVRRAKDILEKKNRTKEIGLYDEYVEHFSIYNNSNYNEFHIIGLRFRRRGARQHTAFNMFGNTLHIEPAVFISLLKFEDYLISFLGRFRSSVQNTSSPPKDNLPSPGVCDSDDEVPPPKWGLEIVPISPITHVPNPPTPSTIHHHRPEYIGASPAPSIQSMQGMTPTHSPSKAGKDDFDKETDSVKDNGLDRSETGSTQEENLFSEYIYITDELMYYLYKDPAVRRGKVLALASVLYGSVMMQFSSLYACKVAELGSIADVRKWIAVRKNFECSALLQN